MSKRGGEEKTEGRDNVKKTKTMAESKTPELVFGPLNGGSLEAVSCVCLGTGRFLRSVLIPAVLQTGSEVIAAQTRSKNFCEYMATRADHTYEVDCVDFDGSVATSTHPLAACGTLGSADGLAGFMDLPSKLPNLRLIGVGVTEAGITLKGPSMINLAQFLHRCMQAKATRAYQLAIINTDNLPSNGDKIKACVRGSPYVLELKAEEQAAFLEWLSASVTFINSMVDRIVSARPGNKDVPRTEPLPLKALVLQDTERCLPAALAASDGVVIRTVEGAIETDHALKLGILNATHTAMVYLGSLAGLRTTVQCIAHPSVMQLFNHLMEEDILAIGPPLGMSRADLEGIFQEWVGRLKHPSFGLDCFWITQNAHQKVGIRFLPVVTAVGAQGGLPSRFMSFAVAVLLRFLTPTGKQARIGENVFVGRLDEPCADAPPPAKTEGKDEYVRGLCVMTEDKQYEFRDGDGSVPKLLFELMNSTSSKPTVAQVTATVKEILLRLSTYESKSKAHKELTKAVGVQLHRMLTGEAAMDVLQSLKPDEPIYISSEKMEDVVKAEVSTVEIIDLHTHLFPPDHGDLMLWGLDELLVYHYLVAEYFTTSTDAHAEFFKLSKVDQATKIWQALFVDRLPVSEACRGVVTTLRKLGLHTELANRDLPAIRAFFKKQDPEKYVETVFKLAGLRYAVMTNIPFDPEEARHWKKGKRFNPKYFRSALRLDAVFLGDWKTVCVCLKEGGYAETMEGARDYLRDWAKVMKPEYLMASTPQSYSYTPSTGKLAPGAVPDAAVLLEQVVAPIARELDLPIAMKFGACRGTNPKLNPCGGGDGVTREGGGSVESLQKLVTHFPHIKWMATFLSRVNQHEACVLANKFGNLHLYGCWWYCNNPSIIKELTSMRIELLGTAFTAQHSDARVLDQLVYKWTHNRAVIAPVVAEKFREMSEAGWRVTREEIHREIVRLFGGSYLEFMAKKLPRSPTPAKL